MLPLTPALTPIDAFCEWNAILGEREQVRARGAQKLRTLMTNDYAATSAPSTQNTGADQEIDHRQQSADDRRHVSECGSVQNPVHAVALFRIDDPSLDRQSLGARRGVKFDRKRHQLEQQDTAEDQDTNPDHGLALE